MSASAPSYDEVQRVSQLDAQRLDEELLSLFLSSTRTTLRFLPSDLLETYTPELKALLRLFFFLNTIAVHKPSPGNALYNLHYRTSTTPHPLSLAQRTLHFLLSVLLPYIWSHLRRRAASHAWVRRRRTTWRLLNVAEAAGRAAALLNLAAFFRTGRYRSPADRVCRARLAYTAPARDAPPTFEFVNSQLVWQGVAEGALLAAPLLAAPTALARTRLGRRVRALFGAAAAGTPPEQGSGEARCGVCGVGDVVMPHRALPCRHLFCYVCVAGALENDPGLRCAVCGAGVHGLERVKFG